MDVKGARQLIEQNLSNKKIFLHMISVAAIMKALAEYLGEDIEMWELAGLLHDIDYERTKDIPERHGLEAENILKNAVSPEIMRAIKAHNFEYTGIKPETKMEKALIAADAASGLVVAAALVMPNKKLEEVNVRTLESKFKQKDFARSVRRERIMFCEDLGLSREKFFEIALNGLKRISGELGL
ncbi:MAG: HDIG domain-containing protein [Nitrososphaeria archaeon]|nr:HDIG domain-containing protein [Nitrososphaeria archaeon]